MRLTFLQVRDGSTSEKQLDVLLCPLSLDKAEKPVEEEGRDKSAPVSPVPAETTALLTSMQASLRKILVPKQVGPDLVFPKQDLLPFASFCSVWPKSNFASLTQHC